MSYRLQAEESIAAGLRRIACEQLDLAVAGLADAKLDRRVAVHEARKCCKRLRGLLRLARAGLGKEVYQAENAGLRDAARQLSDLRNAEALLETYDKLGERFAGEVDRRRIAPVRRALIARRRRLAEGDDALERRVADFRAELNAARARTPYWPLTEAGFDVLAPGLKHTYRRSRKAMRAAYDAPSSERFHDWRKRVKYHRYHLDLLCELWPRPLKARRKEVKALGTMLGDEHDLAVLRATLEAEDKSLGRRQHARPAGPRHALARRAAGGDASARRPCVRRAPQGAGGALRQLLAQLAKRGGG